MSLFQNIRKGLIPARLTVADIVALQAAGILGEDDRFELIDGEIVPMAAMRSAPHEDMKRRLAKLLIRALADEIGVFIETSIAFDTRSYLVPDIAVFSAALPSTEARGPDMLLVIEVATSSIAFDTTAKARLYAGFGVREYWVVDAVRETIRVHRRPVDGVYDDVEEYERHEPVAALLPGIAVTLETLG